MKKFALIISFIFSAIFSHASDSLYVKTLDLHEGLSPAEKIKAAAHIVPSASQTEWQQLELTAFIHFGVNTFTGREWGTGKESPEVFNPTELDTEQWVKILHDAGFKLVILTAKHHDGFCLWPTATTHHSVASSPWRDGNGDVVGELKRSCDKYGMKLGLYLSPWDRNASAYGTGEPYNDLYIAQLTELLTRYGTIDEVWFDGACGEGPDGRRQVYDWKRITDTVHSLQPQAVTAISGDDVRWVGNEYGLGRETEWSVTPLTPRIVAAADSINDSLCLNELSPDLGSNELVARATSLRWWPSEVDVSIRRGWFYHPEQDPKSLDELKNIYLASVGRNSVLLLNIPPDTRGLIAESDSTRLAELGGWLRESFAEPLAVASSASPLSVFIPEGVTVNCLELAEDINRGQRVESFEIYANTPEGDQLLLSGTTVGYKRLVTFSDISGATLQLKITSSRDTPVLRPIKAYGLK